MADNYTTTKDGFIVFPDGIESDIHIDDLVNVYPTPDPEHDREVMRKAHEGALAYLRRKAERDASQG